MQGPPCKTCGYLMDWLSTTNEWKYYCPKCNTRYNEEGLSINDSPQEVDKIMFEHWKTIISPFDEKTFLPIPLCQDVEVGVRDKLNDSVVAAYAGARLALKLGGTYRINIGVFIIRPDGFIEASCCFIDGHVVHQSGDREWYGRIK